MVGTFFAVKPRCKYWDNLHERLIPSLPHIFKDLIAYFPRNSSRKTGEERKKGIEREEAIEEKKGRDRCRIELGANSALNLQTVSKLWVHNFFPPASSWWCSLFWLACISSLQYMGWAKYQSHLSDLGQEYTGGKEGNREIMTRNPSMNTISRKGYESLVRFCIETTVCYIRGKVGLQLQ